MSKVLRLGGLALGVVLLAGRADADTLVYDNIYTSGLYQVEFTTTEFCPTSGCIALAPMQDGTNLGIVLATPDGSPIINGDGLPQGQPIPDVTITIDAAVIGPPSMQPVSITGGQFAVTGMGAPDGNTNVGVNNLPTNDLSENFLTLEPAGTDTEFPSVSPIVIFTPPYLSGSTTSDFSNEGPLEIDSDLSADGGYITSFTEDLFVTRLPEPGGAALTMVGLGVLLAWRRRR